MAERNRSDRQKYILIYIQYVAHSKRHHIVYVCLYDVEMAIVRRQENEAFENIRKG